MKFGHVPLDEAFGAINARSIKLADLIIREGKRLSADDIEVLRHANITPLIAASLEHNDVHENEKMI